MSGCGQVIRPYPLKFFGTHLSRLFADYDPADSSAWATLFSGLTSFLFASGIHAWGHSHRESMRALE